MNWGRLAVENHRGVLVPRVLGLVLAGAVAISAPVVAVVDRVEPAGWGVEVAALLVFAAGLVDDLVPIGPRGLRGHARSLAAGHMTTGILKLLVIVASGVVVVALLPPRDGWVRIVGVVLVAATTNVANGLDVRPGRALKFLLPVAAPVSLVGVPLALVPAFPFVALAGLAVLPLDLRERAMLGDGGSNVLGFVIGVGAYTALGDPAVIGATLFAVGLNLLADTLTLSRAIEAVRPLRRYDAWGRIPSPG